MADTNGFATPAVPVSASPPAQNPNKGEAHIEADYSPPEWSAPPVHDYGLEVLKDGSVAETFDLSAKPFYVVGRQISCDISAMHGSISRNHAVFQHRDTGEMFLFDLGSIHGTRVNKRPIPPSTYVRLRVGDVIKFGESTRLYVVTGPESLLPAERPLRKAVPTTTKLENDGTPNVRPAISGDGEDGSADDEEEDGCAWGQSTFEVAPQEEDEIEDFDIDKLRGDKPLSNHQQQLIDKYEKLRQKIQTYQGEIERIERKDIDQGGLTPGQQQVVDRNTSRIQELSQEMESMQEMIVDALRKKDGEAGGSVAGKKRKRRRGGSDDDDEDDGDEMDDFYDRTGQAKGGNKKKKKKQKVVSASRLMEQKADQAERAETIESLEAKLAAASTQMGRLRMQLAALDAKSVATEADELDSFMTDVSSSIKAQTAQEITAEIEALQADMSMWDAVLGRKKRLRDLHLSLATQQKADAMAFPQPQQTLQSQQQPQPQPQPQQTAASVEAAKGGSMAAALVLAKRKKEQLQRMAEEEEERKRLEAELEAKREIEASKRRRVQELTQFASAVAKGDMPGSDAAEGESDAGNRPSSSSPFGLSKDAMDYKRRIEAMAAAIANKQRVAALGGEDDGTDIVNRLPALRGTAGGLIVRKKPTQAGPSLPASADDAHDGVGDQTADDDAAGGAGDGRTAASAKAASQPRGVGEEEDADETSSWVPPKNQTGDGRTALNAKFGY